MKKYSRSYGKKICKKTALEAQTNSVEDSAEPMPCMGGNGDQQEKNEREIPQKSTQLISAPQTQPIERGLTLMSNAYNASNYNNMAAEGQGDRSAPAAVQQANVYDRSHCEFASVDCTDIAQVQHQPQPELSLPLNCVWGNGMQFQTTYDLAASVAQYSLPPPPPTAIPIPVVQMPHFNSQLPFPDRSGNINPFATYGLQNSMLQPPAPTLNASLGFPSVYVSPAGLITVLLKYDIAIEMTVDKNIRVVNHRHKAVAATNNRGSSSCVYHLAAKIFQDGTKTEVEVFGERRARMQTDGILFASGLEVYLLDDNHIVPSQFVFNDMSKDNSVNILFTPGMVFTNDILIHCDEITKNSRYYFRKDSSTTIIINNIKIHQDEHGEVQVTAGPRYISTSPIYGNIYLQTHFVEISAQVNWNVSVQRGCQKLNSTYTNFVVCNSQHEAGFNQFRDVFSRAYNPTVSEFENWLPSLTFLCQGLPQNRKNRQSVYGPNRENQRSLGEGDQACYTHP